MFPHPNLHPNEMEVKGIKGLDSDEISHEHRVNNLTLTWRATLLKTFPRNISY